MKIRKQTEITRAIYEEAIRIGNSYVEHCISEESHVYWESQATTGALISENVYSGASGINLFLIDLYQSNNDDKILQIIRNNGNWLIEQCEKTVPGGYTFHLGRLGTIYTIIKIYQLTKDDSYLNKALSCLSNLRNVFGTTGFYRDMLTGTAGIIYGLILIRNEISFENFEELINEGVELLLKELHLGRRGIYWQRNQLTIRGLCGLAHGAAGLGLVFWELGKIFSNESFYQLGRMAFDYENFYFSESENEWPDFRLKEHGNLEKHLNLYREGKMSQLLTPRYLTAWCHGSVGIGLTRFRAYEISGQSEYLEQALNAADKAILMSNVLKSDSDLSLCHGLSGIGLILAKAFSTSKDQKYKFALDNLSATVLKSAGGANKSIAGGELRRDPSLFTGLAGVGYFFLKYGKDEFNESILCPPINFKHNPINKKNKTLFKSLLQIKEHIAIKAYGRTLAFLKIKKKTLYEETINGLYDLSDVKSELMKCLKKASQQLDKKNNKQFLDIFNIEEKIISIDEKINSHNLLMLEKLTNQTILNDHFTNDLESKKFLNVHIILNSNVHFVKSKWKWGHLNDNFFLPEFSSAGEYILMFVANSLNIDEYYISEFSHQVFSGFKSGAAIAEVILNLIKAIGINQEQEDKARTLVLKQISEGLKSGILLIDKSSYPDLINL